MFVSQKQGPIPEHQAAMLVYEVLRIVRCCHSANILHGDIKVSSLHYSLHCVLLDLLISAASGYRHLT